MRWTGLSGPPASQNAPARDVAAAEAAAAAEHQARYNLDREAEERHIRWVNAHWAARVLRSGLWRRSPGPNPPAAPGA